MSRFMWLAFEAWAVQRLLRSQVFQQGVRKVYRKVNRLPPEEEITSIENKQASFLKHFKDEIQAQFNGTAAKDPKMNHKVKDLTRKE